MKKNALNLSILLTMLISYSILLVSPGLLSLGAFEDTGAASFIGLGLISMGMGLCLFLALYNDGRASFNWLMLAFVYVVYMMREADFHHAFSSVSLTNIDAYRMEEIPFGIRLIAATVLLSMTAILIYFMIKFARVILRNIFSAESWAIALLLWFVLLFCSQVFDRAISTSGSHWKLSAIEELLEISAALFAVLSLGQFAVAQKRLE